MSIIITSSTDSPEAVLAAQGGAVEPKDKVIEKPAAEEIPAETLEASDASDETETDDEDSADSGKETPKKSKNLDKRFGKLTKQREDARREAAFWREEALKNKPSEAKPVEAEAKADSTGKPNAEKFGTHEEYVEALADWKVDQKLSAREATQKQNELKSDQEKQLKTFLDRREAFAKTAEDFFERMADINDIPMSLTVNESVLSLENGPELLYELAKDPEEYKRICALPAIAAAREIGKLEARLTKSSDTKTETKTTKAPKPPSPVTSGKSTSTKSLEDLDYRDYKKAREAGRTA